MTGTNSETAVSQPKVRQRARCASGTARECLQAERKDKVAYLDHLGRYVFIFLNVSTVVLGAVLAALLFSMTLLFYCCCCHGLEG